MTRQEIKGNLRIIKGKVREQWGELTNDEVDQFAGETDQLVGAIQKRYGRSLEEARQDVAAWRRKNGDFDFS